MTIQVSFVKIFFLSISLLFSFSFSQSEYSLSYTKNDSLLHVEIILNKTDSLVFVMPQTAPGNYGDIPYSDFLVKLYFHRSSGGKIPVKKISRSRFRPQEKASDITSFSYQVNLKKMERELLDVSSSSKYRKNYVGLLNNSVFGFFPSKEKERIHLRLGCERNWQIFSSHKPQKQGMGEANYQYKNFDELADSQLIFGSDFNLIQLKNSPIPFYISLYSEAKLDHRKLIEFAEHSLNALKDYFGVLPMPHYSMMIEYLKPLSLKHNYGFWMEHRNSMTGFSSIDKIMTAKTKPTVLKKRLRSIIHHMAHSWIPQRSYGIGYRPIDWEKAPQLKTVWLNEGFIWYLTSYSIMKDTASIDFYKKIVQNSADFIKYMNLEELSIEASTRYAEDFRVGKNSFARGALFAHELNLFIQKKTNGKKSFRDLILGLYHWSQAEKRGFKMSELPQLFSKSSGVNIQKIWNKWQLAPIDW